MGWRMTSSEILSLLPHGREACFLDEVLELAEREVVCGCSVPLESPYVIDGWAPAFVVLEIAAQAAAIAEAVNAVQTRRTTAPQVGYLVRVRSLVLSCAKVPAGTPLRAHATLDATAPPLSIYRVRVHLDERKILEGSISLFIPTPA